MNLIEDLNNMLKANILVLEDAEYRLKIFKNKIPSCKISNHANDMINSIIDNPNSFIFLDHDLDGRVWVPVFEKNTGSEVARWIVENNPEIHRIIIHSKNTIGAKHMSDLLSKNYNVEIIPFNELQILLESNL